MNSFPLCISSQPFYGRSCQMSEDWIFLPCQFLESSSCITFVCCQLTAFYALMSPSPVIYSRLRYLKSCDSVDFVLCAATVSASRHFQCYHPSWWPRIGVVVPVSRVGGRVYPSYVPASPTLYVLNAAALSKPGARARSNT